MLKMDRKVDISLSFKSRLSTVSAGREMGCSQGCSRLSNAWDSRWELLGRCHLKCAFPMQILCSSHAILNKTMTSPD